MQLRGNILDWTMPLKEATISFMDHLANETVKNYQMKIEKGYPYNVNLFQEKLEALKNGEGQTLCDIIIEIFGDHRNIELILKD